MPKRQPKERLLRMPEIKERTGLTRGAVYGRMNEGTFPLAIRIGPATVAWRESEIDEWIRHQIEANERQREAERETARVREVA